MPAMLLANPITEAKPSNKQHSFWPNVCTVAHDAHP